MTFASVIPLVRLPARLNGLFDYALPEGMQCAVGQIVLVPFRGSAVPALVAKLMNESPVAARAKHVLGPYGSLTLPSAFVDLIFATAERTFTSPATVLKAWLRALPKRPPTQTPLSLPASVRTQTHAPATEWVIDPSEKIIDGTRTLIKEKHSVLIIVPWKSRIETYARAFSHASVLDSSFGSGQAFHAWFRFYSGETNIIITTRLGAWLACFSDHTFVEEPENDDHKQDELAPRYDARAVVAWCTGHGRTCATFFGITPKLSSSYQGDRAPTVPLELLTCQKAPGGQSRIPMIQADTLEILRAHRGKRIIIHPIRGLSARIVCADCGWRAICERCGHGLSALREMFLCRPCGWKRGVLEQCPNCGGADLARSIPGILKLQAAWREHEPTLDAEWRDLSNEATDRPFPSGSLVVVTDAALLAGHTEDVRREERLMISFRRLASRIVRSSSRLLLQGPESLLNDLRSSLSEIGLTNLYERLMKERRLFGYPPAVKLVKVIVTGSETDALAWKDHVSYPLSLVSSEWRGPFAVANRPTSRSARWIWHLVFPQQASDEGVIDTLKPFSGSAVIDLDPVAFFK